MKQILDNPVATFVIVVIVLVGAADLLVDGVLSGDFKRYVETIDIPLAGLALGRGFAAGLRR